MKFGRPALPESAAALHRWRVRPRTTPDRRRGPASTPSTGPTAGTRGVRPSYPKLPYTFSSAIQTSAAHLRGSPSNRASSLCCRSAIQAPRTSCWTSRSTRRHGCGHHAPRRTRRRPRASRAKDAAGRCPRRPASTSGRRGRRPFGDGRAMRRDRSLQRGTGRRGAAHPRWQCRPLEAARRRPGSEPPSGGQPISTPRRAGAPRPPARTPGRCRVLSPQSPTRIRGSP